MTGRQRREIALLVVAVVALGVGGVELFVSPVRSDLRQARASLDEARRRAQRARAGEPGASKAASLIESAQRRLEWMRSASDAARDAANLYDRITALADRFGVRIDRMRPARRGESADGGEPISTIAYSISAVGEYQPLAHFIDAIERDLGFSRVSSFNLRPVQINGEPKIRASIETTHHSVRMAEVDPASSLGGGV